MVDDLTIRAAGSDDLGAIEALYARASLANEGDRDVLLANPEVLQFPLERIEGGNVIVASRAGDTVGFASVEPGDDGTAELVDLFVEPAVWKQGIGRRLIGAALDHAASAGATVLMVVGNSHSEGFYRACGFETVGSVETRFGPGLRMRKPIPRAE